MSSNHVIRIDILDLGWLTSSSTIQIQSINEDAARAYHHCWIWIDIHQDEQTIYDVEASNLGCSTLPWPHRKSFFRDI